MIYRFSKEGNERGKKNVGSEGERKRMRRGLGVGKKTREVKFSDAHTFRMTI
jgi:hypothetical protein